MFSPGQGYEDETYLPVIIARRDLAGEAMLFGGYSLV